MLSLHLPAKFAFAVQIQVANLSGRLLYFGSDLVFLISLLKVIPFFASVLLQIPWEIANV